MLAAGGKMILGSDSHTRYGALGTMAMGEGGPELVKQLLSQTYDINMPGVVAIYLTGCLLYTSVLYRDMTAISRSQNSSESK